MGYKSDFKNDKGWSAVDCNRKLNTQKGRRFLDFLHSKGVTTIVRYYASSRRAKTMSGDEALFLSGEGFNLLPVYQDNNRTIADFGKSNGEKSARNALKFTEFIGQQSGTTILFAVDTDFLVPDIKKHILPYFEAINAEIGSNYRIGAYGSGAVMELLLANDLIEVPWLSMSRGFTGTKEFFYSDRWAFRQVPPEQKHSTSDIGYDKNVLNWTPENLGTFRVGIHVGTAATGPTGLDAVLGGGNVPFETDEDPEVLALEGASPSDSKSTSRHSAIAPRDAQFLATAGSRATGSDESILRTLADQYDLEMPTERLIALRNSKYPTSRPRYWAVVNFDLHSAKPRLFVFDVVAQSVATYRCAHGKGSEGPTDDGMADVFSNVSGSNASSLGIYRCAETYQSRKNGYSLKLDGLEDTNSNARSRYIVMHGADYVSKKFARRHGRVGRSQGCPAVDFKYTRKVIDQLKLGSLLIHWQTP